MVLTKYKGKERKERNAERRRVMSADGLSGWTHRRGSCQIVRRVTRPEPLTIIVGELIFQAGTWCTTWTAP